ncbi:MAG: chemotaxis protein CheB, partial [Ketobacteraceae bacterium]|nr:chemotaxis protein CheB [Ketobacteraceae bacterium]
TQAGADITLESLNIGAFDFVAKPRENLGKGLAGYQEEIAAKIRAAAKVNIGELERRAQRSRQEPVTPTRSVSGYTPRGGQIIAIGASTGGTEAIKDVLSGLPENCPPIVIAQHIPVNFSASYAARLNENCAMHVQEAQSAQKLLPGNAYIAPGDQHMIVRKRTNGLVVQLLDSERVNHHKPSVEVLFDSITQLELRSTIGVLLTGMGADGSQALLRMKEIGCHTIIQDEATSVVWGMPGVAYKLGAHTEVKPLGAIAGRLLELTNNKTAQRDVKSSA